MKKTMGKKSLSWIVFSAFILLCFMCSSWAVAEEWELSDGGMSMDAQKGGLFAATGTGGDPTTPLTANLTLLMGTGGEFFSTDQSIRPAISMDATDFVDVYAAAVLADLVVYYDICTGDLSFDAPLVCYADSLDTEVFNYPAIWLADMYPGETYVPFGVFIRVVEAGTGLNGNILADKAVTTFIADLPPLPAPAQSPW